MSCMAATLHRQLLRCHCECSNGARERSSTAVVRPEGRSAEPTKRRDPETPLWLGSRRSNPSTIDGEHPVRRGAHRARNAAGRRCNDKAYRVPHADLHGHRQRRDGVPRAWVKVLCSQVATRDRNHKLAAAVRDTMRQCASVRRGAPVKHGLLGARVAAEKLCREIEVHPQHRTRGAVCETVPAGRQLEIARDLAAGKRKAVRPGHVVFVDNPLSNGRGVHQVLVVDERETSGRVGGRHIGDEVFGVEVHSEKPARQAGPRLVHRANSDPGSGHGVAPVQSLVVSQHKPGGERLAPLRGVRLGRCSRPCLAVVAKATAHCDRPDRVVGDAGVPHVAERDQGQVPAHPRLEAEDVVAHVEMRHSPEHHCRRLPLRAGRLVEVDPVALKCHVVGGVWSHLRICWTRPCPAGGSDRDGCGAPRKGAPRHVDVVRSRALVPVAGVGRNVNGCHGGVVEEGLLKQHGVRLDVELVVEVVPCPDILDVEESRGLLRARKVTHHQLARERLDKGHRHPARQMRNGRHRQRRKRGVRVGRVSDFDRHPGDRLEVRRAAAIVPAVECQDVDRAVGRVNSHHVGLGG
eukprot:m.40844 g.40844  ORF g.40844 m.40844 type:complete len:577 (-) comp14030_c0_seq1:1587-3317(-)